MTVSQTPDPATVSTVTGEPIAATDELGRADMKKSRKQGMSAGAHAALWSVIGFFLAMIIIAAWPFTLLMINGG